MIWDDAALADRLEEEAADLKTRFNRDFWLEDRGYYALALDGDKKPVDSLTSNLGHLLWSGIVADDRVGRVVELLLGDRLYSGWGIRTFATGQAGYNPIGYHLGTVWPHDTAFAVLGLAQHGYRAEAAEVAMGLLEAADLLGNRLPEAFAGFDRRETSFPAEYPTACSPQAWASGAPLLLIRAVLGLEPDGAVLRSRPLLPEPVRRLSLHHVPGRWGTRDIAVDLTDEVVTVGVDGGRDDVLEELVGASRRLPVDVTLGHRLTIGFDLGTAGTYRLVADDGRLFIDRHADDAQTRLVTDADTLLALLRGTRQAATTVISGRARLEGDPELGGQLLAFFNRQGTQVR